MVKSSAGFEKSERKTFPIEIIIERSGDSFSAYAEKIPGVYGQGDTVEEAKVSALTGLELFKKYNSKKNFAETLRKESAVTFKYDISSFLNYYNNIFTKAALERITGINQKLLQHYASGLKKPRPAQVKKISEAIRKLGEELISVRF